MRLIVKTCLVFIALISITACSKVETDAQKTHSEQGIITDSMPTIEPDLPENINIVKPNNTDSMPTVHPEDIDIQ